MAQALRSIKEMTPRQLLEYTHELAARVVPRKLGPPKKKFEPTEEQQRIIDIAAELIEKHGYVKRRELHARAKVSSDPLQIGRINNLLTDARANGLLERPSEDWRRKLHLEPISVGPLPSM